MVWVLCPDPHRSVLVFLYGHLCACYLVHALLPGTKKDRPRGERSTCGRVLGFRFVRRANLWTTVATLEARLALSRWGDTSSDSFYDKELKKELSACKTMRIDESSSFCVIVYDKDIDCPTILNGNTVTMPKEAPRALHEEECIELLLNDEKFEKLANKRMGSVEQVRAELTKENPLECESMQYLVDDLLELMANEGDYIDSHEIEYLTSYSSTSTFELRCYSGIYFVDNVEYGGSCRYRTAQEAKEAVEIEAGFKWGAPDNRLNEISGDRLANLIDNTDAPKIDWNAK